MINIETLDSWCKVSKNLANFSHLIITTQVPASCCNSTEVWNCAEILDYFSITGIAQTTTEIHISLDERMNNALSNDAHFESKGFMEVANVTDFPIRDHKVILKIRRRRWKDLRTGKSFSIPIDLDIVAKGTRYSKEFGAFLKETYGDVPGDLPYA